MAELPHTNTAPAPTNVNDIVHKRIAEAARRREERRLQRREFAEARKRGLYARHTAKLGRQRQDDGDGA
ncbi:hypothetical protein [Streptomyces sp. NPDC050355]|uniref:hypothetical protein n=1 Tax=Streptomyces sp. NPDC050355 TaxID=3365609 RepID=UPI00378FEE73